MSYLMKSIKARKEREESAEDAATSTTSTTPSSSPTRQPTNSEALGPSTPTPSTCPQHKTRGPSPLTVARAFVKQYYQVLMAKDPGEIVTFYKTDSVVSLGDRCFGIGKNVESGVALVLGRLSHCEKLAVTSIDAQRSQGGGVLVVVTGQLLRRQKRPRAFSHTFFLSLVSNHDSTCQEYYVLNDVWRFVEDAVKSSRRGDVGATSGQNRTAVGAVSKATGGAGTLSVLSDLSPHDAPTSHHRQQRKSRNASGRSSHHPHNEYPISPPYQSHFQEFPEPPPPLGGSHPPPPGPHWPYSIDYHSGHPIPHNPMQPSHQQAYAGPPPVVYPQPSPYGPPGYYTMTQAPNGHAPWPNPPGYKKKKSVTETGVAESKKSKKRLSTTPAASAEKTKKRFVSPGELDRIKLATTKDLDVQNGGINTAAATRAATMTIPRGVTLRPSGRWQTQVYFQGASRYIGVFDSQEQACLAYEIARESLKSDQGLTQNNVELALELARDLAVEGVARKSGNGPSRAAEGKSSTAT